MGHQRLGRLPKSKLWREVVALVAGGADLRAIAAKTARAAEASIVKAGSDPLARHALWLLARVPLAAREKDFRKALAEIGMVERPELSMADVVSGMVDCADRRIVMVGRRSDYGEMALLAAAESLYSLASQEADLFGASEERDREAFRRLGTPKGFARLARDFFARLTNWHLSYFLDRELPQHLGAGRRFPSLRDLHDFEGALEQHCYEGSRIIQEYAEGWFAKQTFEGGITRSKADRFLAYAVAKVRSELQMRSVEHA